MGQIFRWYKNIIAPLKTMISNQPTEHLGQDEHTSLLPPGKDEQACAALREGIQQG